MSDLSAQIIAIARRLIAAASPNPSGETEAAAAAAAAALRDAVPGVALSLHRAVAPVTNLVARLRGARPGRRLIFNGHLDTYPINQDLPWTVPPLGGVVKDGRLYGRGAADMKGGIAAAIAAMAMLAAEPRDWAGEVVLTLAGDEESMGPHGTKWLLDTVPEAVGDAAIIADAGSPHVVRFGEKGFLWVELEATGRASHGAHVHLGINALDRMRAALQALERLRALPVSAPPAVREAIAAAKPVSEQLSGAGESEVLQQVTVNTGYLHAGTSMNLVPPLAQAGADIRLPVGVTADAAEAALDAALGGLEGVRWRILRRVAPNYTPPDAEIVACVAGAAGEVLGSAPCVNMRVGGSDARLFRAANIPAVVYGPTPFNMGGADENVLISDLLAVAQVHFLAAQRFLSR